MRLLKLFSLLPFCFSAVNVSSQVEVPAPYPQNSKISFVRTWTATVPERNANTLITRPVEDVQQNTDYLDGLGRTIQSVAKHGSIIKDPSNPNNEIVRDFVIPYKYDEIGREKHKYLPFGATNDDGAIKYNSFQQQASFYQSLFPTQTYFYGESIYDQSPLNKITKFLAPGNGWIGAGVGPIIAHEFNSITEQVRVWNIDFIANATPYSSSIYATGKLGKAAMTDENGNKVYTYIDSDGRVILQKVQELAAGNGLNENGHDGWLCTYFVYDDLGQLRSVITPKAVRFLENNSWGFTSNEVYQELCFWNEYDFKGNIIIKHSPGAGQMFFIYDQKGRVVLSQDENQRNRSVKQWTFYLYDKSDRLLANGLFDKDATLEQMNTHVKSLNNGIATISIFTGLTEWITVENPVIGNPAFCNNCSNIVINNVFYFDNYNYVGAKAFNNSYNFAPTSNPYVEATQVSVRVEEFPTGLKTRVLNQNYDDNNPNNDQFLTETSYYDDKARIIQVLKDNVKNATDYTTRQYDYAGKLLGMCESHTMPGTTISNFQIIRKHEYDKLSRISRISKKIGGLEYKKIAEYAYDQFGRIKEKKLAPDFNGGQGIETLKYDYNIRGWINGINKDYVLANTSLNQWDNFFGIYLGYENGDGLFADAQHGGSLTGTIWKSQGDNMPRKFDFHYDHSQRFTGAAFSQLEKPTDVTWNNAKMDFSVSAIQYDANGNLLQLYQKGVIPGNNLPVFIDKLIYEYKSVSGGSWSNQLRRIFDQTTDLSANNNGSLYDFKDELYGLNMEDYTYDGNGNMVKDNNKKIRNGNSNGVEYNFLDKPQKIINEGKSVVEFIYDSGGEKLGKKITNTTSGISSTTWYVGQFVYEEVNAVVKLSLILHEEGRIRVYQPVTNPRVQQGGGFDLPDNNKGVFEYFIKDHLLNTRMILTEESHSELNDCSMEAANAFYEERMFGQVDINGNPVTNSNEVILTRKDKQTYAPGWNVNSSNTVSRLKQDENRIGPNMILKVMAGDLISAQVQYYYTGTVDNSTSSSILPSLLGSILSSLSFTPPSQTLHSSSTNIYNNYLSNPAELGNFLTNQQGGINVTPQAYLNILFFDENFNFVAYDNVTGLGSNGWRVGGSGDNQPPIVAANIKCPKNGYAFIFLSNDSKTSVYFDNLSVIHNKGRIVEENAYYPHGLRIKGISAKAFDKGSNLFGYQADFAELEIETGWYEFELRNMDPQTGRWTSVDPENEFASPYVGMGNNPVNLLDPSGGSILDIGSAVTTNFVGTAIGAITGAAAGYLLSGNTGHSTRALNTLMGFIGGAVLGNLSQEVGYNLWDAAETAGNLVTSVSEIADAGSAPPIVIIKRPPKPNWQPFKKSDLVEWYKAKYNKDPTENDLGTEFERIFQMFIRSHPNLFGENLKRNKTTFTDANDRNTQPDFVGNAKIVKPANIRILGAVWVEVKAMYGNLYLSSNDGQIKGHIDNIHARFQQLKIKYARYQFRPKLVLITTADVGPSKTMGRHAEMFQNVAFAHIQAEFYKEDLGNGKTKWVWRFTKDVTIRF